MFSIVGLGEILWDIFPDGPRFGGAPANFACSAAALGGLNIKAAVTSSVGVDQLGRQAIRELQKRDVNTACVAPQERPTGSVQVTLDDQGKASYEFAADTAWDAIPWTAGMDRLAHNADAVCFGTLGQRTDSSRETIQRFVRATRPGALRIFDINLRPPYYSDEVIRQSLLIANVLKLNDDELPLLATLAEVQGTEAEQLQQLSEQYDLQCAALTRGAQGALLVQGDEVSEHAGAAINVVDTVGAGDAFTAAFALGLLAKDPLDAINQRACQVAAYVCTQPGATPDLSGLDV